MIRLTRRYRFSASHRLHLENLSEAANQELYGKCNNPYGHGHDYLLEVTVRGPLDAATGQVVNIAALDSLVQNQVIDDFEHKNLNIDVVDFERAVPTSENIIRVIEQRLRVRWRQALGAEWPVLDGVRLRETRNNSFELKS
jgi:6-pyruvoyltetrahydropterin/6-carboxytetrahydropterin synthase